MALAYTWLFIFQNVVRKAHNTATAIILFKPLFVVFFALYHHANLMHSIFDGRKNVPPTIQIQPTFNRRSTLNVNKYRVCGCGIDIQYCTVASWSKSYHKYHITCHNMHESISEVFSGIFLWPEMKYCTTKDFFFSRETIVNFNSISQTELMFWAICIRFACLL